MKCRNYTERCDKHCQLVTDDTCYDLEPPRLKYEDIIEAIEKVPLTQIGVIMIKAVEEAHKRKFFADDEVLFRVVEKIIKK